MQFSVCGRWSDLISSDQTRSPCEREQVGCARVAEIGDRTLDDSYTHVDACAALCVSMTTKNGGRSLDVLRAFSFSSRLLTSVDEGFFPFSESRTERPKGGREGEPWPSLPKWSYSLLMLTLTWFWAVLFTTMVIWASQALVACIGFGAFYAKLHPAQYLWNQTECRKSSHWSSEELFGMMRTPSLVD